ncbi:MAG: glycine--tRNA ligase [Verrucomicrobiales bacterium]|mgnify:CR=1 FL=1|jgi:glycyl-tRNA synthetase|nr:glycine--tRNA ligase [Verrucomicrobiales bacterium]MDC0312419.1 glycine--tRNA ligase [Verrucomicrobiales bacterium]
MSKAKSSSDNARNVLMDKIVSLCKRRGFVFQSSEIYGGLNGCWDYGPLGAELKKNLKDYWWTRMVRDRDDVVGMDGAILQNRRVWEASGHVGTFSDPLVDCKETKARFRADQIFYASAVIGGESHGYVSVTESPTMAEEAEQKIRKIQKKGGIKGEIAALEMKPLMEATPEEHALIPSPNSTEPGTLTEPREFNLMFKTYVGPVENDSNVTYLRPETAQAIFVQFKNVCDSSRIKIPFGIAQIGKAFRNEINPRNFTFRSREFEQMEIEYFCRPEEGLPLLKEWLETRLKFYEEIGIPREKLHILDVPEKERAHYSGGTYDIEYEFPFGIQELEGVAYRTNYDLTKHQEHSGKTLEYIDQATNEKFIPHVVEPSAGVDRTVLAVICEAFDEETITNEKGKEEVRTVLRFSPRMAPIKCGIFPLLKNKPELVAKAREVQEVLRPHMNVFYDEGGAVGRRYRRQDEIGTPFCVTIDFDTIGENGPEAEDTVTVRERDAMTQERIKIADLLTYLLERLR